MKQPNLLTATLLLATQLIIAQNIEMSLVDPQPDLQGSDTGDMEFADLDNDGDLDLIITGSGNFTSGEVHSARTTIYFNDGEGNLIDNGNSGVENIRVSKIGVADIDNDDDLDLLISGSTHGGTALTRLYTNDGSANFTVIPNTPFHNLDSGYFNFGDIDGDNDMDIVYSGQETTPANLIKFTNDGNGNFTQENNIGINNIAGVLELFDYDNDNDLDTLISGVDQSGAFITRLYNNDGNGIFTLVPNSGLNDLFSDDIAVGDTDEDGDLDVLIFGRLNNGNLATQFYTNNGDGTFNLQTDTPFADVSFGGEASFNDFDNDGDLDVFLIGSEEGGLPNIFSYIYQNEGNNSFILSDAFIGAYLSTHAVADIDNDNFLDLVIGGTTTGSPVRASFIYRNITEGNLNVEDFSTLNDISLAPNPSNGMVQIKLDTTANATYKMFDMTGKLLMTSPLALGTNTIEFNVPNGIYLISVQSDKGLYAQKLMVQN